MSLVEKIAKKYHYRLPKHIQLDELKSAGYLGLIDAAHKYKESYKVEFSSYAYCRILGAIKDDLKKRNPLNDFPKNEPSEPNTLATHTVSCNEDQTRIEYYQPQSGFTFTHKNEIKELLSRLIKLQPEDQQKVIIACYFDDLGIAEIATKYALTESKVFWLRNEALKDLINLVKDKGLYKDF